MQNLTLVLQSLNKGGQNLSTLYLEDMFVSIPKHLFIITASDRAAHRHKVNMVSMTTFFFF